MTQTTFFVDVFAWGVAAKIQAAFRQVRDQVADQDIHVGKSHKTAAGLDQLTDLPAKAVGRVLPLVVDARSMANVIETLWSASFIRQGGVMAVVALDLNDPTPATGWIYRTGMVLRQGWDVPTSAMPTRDAQGQVTLEGRQGADRVGETWVTQFLQLPSVQPFLSAAAAAALAA